MQLSILSYELQIYIVLHVKPNFILAVPIRQTVQSNE